MKRGKTDAGDAEAICEAVTRPTMRFVAIKSPEQQSLLALHRARDLLIGQRTQLVNMMPGQLAEFGIVLAKGIQHVLNLVARLVEGEIPDIPAPASLVVIILAAQVRDLQSRLRDLDKDLLAWQLQVQQISHAQDHDEYCWVFSLLKAGAGQIDNTRDYGFEVDLPYRQMSLLELRETIDQEFLVLSQAHYDRYIKPPDLFGDPAL